MQLPHTATTSDAMENLRISERTPHPLEQLSVAEASVARDVILSGHSKTVIDFRTICLEEPAKAQLQPFLDAESEGSSKIEFPLPARLARVAYDVLGENKTCAFYESIVDVNERKIVAQELIDAKHQAPLTLYVFLFPPRDFETNK